MNTSVNQEFNPTSYLNSKVKLKIKKLPVNRNPLELFSKMYQTHKHVYLLESIEGPRKLAQYSFLGFNPSFSIQFKKGNVLICNEKTNEEVKEQTESPLRKIDEFMTQKKNLGGKFRFVGGAVGYIGYDAIRYWEKLPEKAIDDLNFPDIEMAFYDDGIVIDHKNKESYYYYLFENRLEEIETIMKKSDDLDALSYQELGTNITKADFEKAVEEAQEHIMMGDIFQVVLSKRYKFKIQGDLINYYRSLRRINPSPYMYFIKMKDRQIIGSSPEMLVRVENNIVETYPIAGTRPHVESSEENDRLSRELLSDPKERAEHVMLVDLARNDIGKISEFGSVCVPEFMNVHQYSHVQHIVSRVVGNLRDDLKSSDALRAVFPAGTVSGAPKVRAMEIIDEIEPTLRGPYAGAVGYFSYNGNADFAITIRTLVADKDKAYIQAGGGIVADSNPEREWFETEHKTKALIRALETTRDDLQ